MSVSGDFDPFLKGMCDQCKMMLSDRSSRSQTVDEGLLKKIESAIEEKVIAPTIGNYMIDHLEEFREYKIGALEQDDKEVIISIFERALKDSVKRVEVDSTYGSGESLSKKELLEKAGFDSESDLKALKREQKGFQEKVKRALAPGQIEDEDGHAVRVRKTREGYVLGLKPIPEFSTIDRQKDLGKDDLPVPPLFTGDHIGDQRCKYMSVHFPDLPLIVVNNAQDAKHLQASADFFTSMRSSDDLSAKHEKRLSKAVLLFTTQHIENGVISPQLLLQKIQLAAMLGEGRFDTYIDSVNCSFDYVAVSGKDKPNHFKVVMEANLLTEMKPTGEGMSVEQKRERMAAREALGLPPALEGRVECSFICFIEPRDGSLHIKDIESKYKLLVRE